MRRPQQRSPKAPSRSDRVCWNLWKIQRLSFDDIAVRQNMTVIAVGKAVQRMEDYKSLHSDEAVNLAINEIALRRIGNVEKVITGAMGAKIVSHEKRGKAGKERYVRTTRPDHAMQLKAVETFKGLIETIRPKAGGVNIALQQNNGMQGGGGEVRSSGNSFEERLRKMREAKGLKDEAEVIIDGEILEGSTLRDELSEIGVDLDDEDDDDDEEEGDDDEN